MAQSDGEICPKMHSFFEEERKRKESGWGCRVQTFVSMSRAKRTTKKDN